MNIRLGGSADVDALVEFNQAMALETEGKRLDAAVLRAGVEAVFQDRTKGFYVVADYQEQIVGGLMVTVNVLLPVPLIFLALIMPLNVPSVVGVPENCPVLLLKLTPGIDTVVP